MIVQSLSADVPKFIYWKIEADPDPWPWDSLCTRIGMYETVGGSNVAILGVTGSASGNAIAGGGSAYDENPASAAEWFYHTVPLISIFQFDVARNIVSFSWTYKRYLGSPDPYIGPANLELFSSPDGITYTSVNTWITSGSWTDGETRTFDV